MSVAFKHAEEGSERTDLIAVAARQDAGDLMQVREIVGSPSGE